jgi:ribosomal protein S18 acetylase RimI-like enzyme
MGLGFGRRLHQSYLNTLSEKVATDVHLKVWHMNKGAFVLYGQLGFKDRRITLQFVV